jgi:hypothetical protein
VVTRSVTVVTDGEKDMVLYKHYDGYPDEVLNAMKKARCFMERYGPDFKHFMGYAEDVAAAIIVSYWKETNSGKSHKVRPPDFRPSLSFDGPVSNELIARLGNGHDADFVYVLNVQDGQWKVDVYEYDSGVYKHLGSADVSCE